MKSTVHETLLAQKVKGQGHKAMRRSSTKTSNISSKRHSVVKMHLSHRKSRSPERTAGSDFWPEVPKGRFHRPGLTLQLANFWLRDNRGLSAACVPSLSVNLTAHSTCDLTSFIKPRLWLVLAVTCQRAQVTLIIIIIAAHSISAMALVMLSYSWCDRKGFSNFNGLQFKNDR